MKTPPLTNRLDCRHLIILALLLAWAGDGSAQFGPPPTMPGAAPGGGAAIPTSMFGAPAPVPEVQVVEEEVLTPLDKAQLRRFATSDWFAATVTAGARIYVMSKEAETVTYSITQGFVPVTTGEIDLSELLAQARSDAKRTQGPPITGAVAGGTLRALKAWRYEVIDAADVGQIVERVGYDAEDLKEAMEEDILFYEELYRGNIPPPPEGQAPAEPRDYAEWFYFYNQLRLWERYVQRLLDREGASRLPEDTTLLTETYPTLTDEYEKVRQQVAEEEHRLLLDLYARQEARQAARDSYRDFQKERMIDIKKFTGNWSERDRGNEIMIDDVRYIRTDEPMPFLPSNAVNLVSPVISPYDLLNEDGSLKKPGQKEKRIEID